MKEHYIILLLLVSNNIFGQWNLSSLPDSLLINKSNILLEGITTLSIYYEENIIEQKTQTILVQQNSANNSIEIVIPFDKFSKVTDLDVVIFQMDGKKIKTIKKKEFQNVAAFDGFTVASDNRFLYYEVIESNLPFVLQYSYTIAHNQSFILPRISVFDHKHVNILESTVKVINYAKSNPITTFSSPWGNPTVRNDEKYSEYEWKISNKINHNADNDQIKPLVIQLNDFQMEGIHGSMKSWSDFGSWISILNSGTENLDEAAKQEIIDVSKNAQTIEEKVFLTYDYLQKKMRYVSIQLGIGGYKPLDVNYVHRNKYGDCKALSNYMKSALNALEIPSKYVLIQAGGNASALDDSISSNPFNHATLMVPMAKDTIWLECTSNTMPAGYQGSFTGNRRALMIDVDNKSTVISTSKSDHKQNLISNTFNIDLAREKMIRHNSELSGMGIEHHSLYFFSKKPISEISKHLRDDVYKAVKDFENSDYQFVPNGPNSKIFFTSSFNSDKYIQKSGQRYFIELGIDQPMWVQKDSPINYGYSVNDVYQIKVPAGCKIEKQPKDSEMKFSAGEIVYKNANKDGIYLVNRSIVIYPHHDNEAIDLLKAASKVQTDKVVIICENRP